MTAPVLPPAVLINLMAAARPAFAGAMPGPADLLCQHQHHGEAFRSYAALAREDDTGAHFKLATLYYMADDDVRAALWFLITGADLPEGESAGERWASAA